MPNPYPKVCCHSDGYLKNTVYLILTLFCMGLGLYVIYVASNGTFGAPLSPMVTNIVIFLACFAVFLILIILYRRATRAKQR